MSHDVRNRSEETAPLHEERLARARLALEGLSVGDAFGETFFVNEDLAQERIAERVLPASPWTYTDDTEMTLSVVTVLRDYGEINQEVLAERFAAHYDIRRGYGPNMHGLLARIREGESYSTAAASLFGGQGSHGNGAAMRVAPVGAYFADDREAVLEQARRSAEVTHTHPEGIAGAIAVAVAAACAWNWREDSSVPDQRAFLDNILRFVPDSVVGERIRHARNLAPDASVRLAVSALGNGVGLSAQDTVPFALWCAARHLDDYEAALWLAVSALGDRDTICAIVGGIVALYTGEQGIPVEWLRAREPLPMGTKERL
jgi:ADP-ribosylglycohydrolase